jgi:hypothetical protein
MNNTRVTVSLALIVLICFFLPWVQLSCGASSNRLSGVDLARDGHTLPWLIPLFMAGDSSGDVCACLARKNSNFSIA